MLPTMTPEQRASALQKAAEIRAARSELKARVKSGETAFSDALAHEAAARMKVSQLIEALPGMGKVRVAQLMERLGIPESRRVGGLGVNQRAALEAEFASVA